MLGSKPLASLSSGLLARKGQARPAMRRQDGLGVSLEDLGWNDMGTQPAPRPAVLVEREALADGFAAAAPEPTATPPASPPVATVDAPEAEPAASTASVVSASVTEDRALPSTKPVSAATAARIGRETRLKSGKTGKAAFTLRLNTDRHLRLRLASAVTNQSSQALVATALDAFLKTLPEVETLVARLSDGETR